MCALHPGQLVEVAASLTSCLRLHSKQATTRLRWPFQRPSIFPKPKPSRDCCEGSLGGAEPVFKVGLGAPGKNERPHWRHIVDFAAAYSICLNPQCGHSTLTLAGDGLATVYYAWRKLPFRLGARSESRFVRLVVTHDLRTAG